MRVWSKVLVAVVACLVAVSVGFGGEEKKEEKEKKKGDRPRFSAEEMIKKLDKNKDGKLSLEEYLAAPWVEKIGKEKAEGRFKQMDADKDGFVTVKEMEKAMGRGGDKKGDKKGDGKRKRGEGKKKEPPKEEK